MFLDMLYEDAEEMVEYLAQALKQTSREATILLYSPGDGSSPAEDDGAGRYDNVTELSLRPQFLVSIAKTNFKARIQEHSKPDVSK
jgi:hypothetical protein